MWGVGGMYVCRWVGVGGWVSGVHTVSVVQHLWRYGVYVNQVAGRCRPLQPPPPPLHTPPRLSGDRWLRSGQPLVRELPPALQVRGTPPADMIGLRGWPLHVKGHTLPMRTPHVPFLCGPTVGCAAVYCRRRRRAPTGRRWRGSGRRRSGSRCGLCAVLGGGWGLSA